MRWLISIVIAILITFYLQNMKLKLTPLIANIILPITLILIIYMSLDYFLDQAENFSVGGIIQNDDVEKVLNLNREIEDGYMPMDDIKDYDDSDNSDNSDEKEEYISTEHFNIMPSNMKDTIYEMVPEKKGHECSACSKA